MQSSRMKVEKCASVCGCSKKNPKENSNMKKNSPIENREENKKESIQN